MSTPTTEANNLVTLLCPYLNLEGGDGESQVSLAVTFLDSQVFECNYIHGLSACLCLVIPLPQEQLRGVFSPGVILPRPSSWSRIHSSPGLMICDSGQISLSLGIPLSKTEWFRLDNS